MAPFTTTLLAGSGKNSVTGLKGSLSKRGNLGVSDRSSVSGLLVSLSGWDGAGGPGCKDKRTYQTSSVTQVRLSTKVYEKEPFH